MALDCWQAPEILRPLDGGISNLGFVVADRGAKFVVRFGDDVAVHQVVRARELAASRAAHAAGIAPAVVHAAPGVLVLDFIEGRTLGAEDVAADAMLARIVPLIQRCHRETPKHLRGPAPLFWPFHIVRDYRATLERDASPHAPELPRLMAAAAIMEEAVGAVDLVLAHNDLLAANIIDDGERLWLIDWEYAGFGSPLFDLGNLAANNGLDQARERWLLESYFDRPATDEVWRRYQAMKCMSLLREAMWSMVSELHSTIDFDYAAYSRTYLDLFDAAHAAFGRL